MATQEQEEQIRLSWWKEPAQFWKKKSQIDETKINLRMMATEKYGAYHIICQT